MPRLDIGKNRAKSAIENFNSAIVDAIGLYPLEKNAVWGQPIVNGFIKLPGEKVGHTCAIWIRRLGNDNIVLATNGEEQLAPVTDDDTQLRVLESLLIYWRTDFSDL